MGMTERPQVIEAPFRPPQDGPAGFTAVSIPLLLTGIPG